jgi:glycosyltransferase involved in cell wall biosynthesis
MPLDVQLPAGPIILSVGRLAIEKAPGDILEAFGLIDPGIGAQLVFVGDGPLRQGLEAAAAARGLLPRVHFVGSDPNPFPWMALADVFVSASMFEAFALTIAEAMAAGVPVIATDCPYGPRELLLDGRCGTLVPPRRPKQLAAAIDNVLSDKQCAQALVRAATARVEDFEQQRVVAQYAALIDEVA